MIEAKFSTLHDTWAQWANKLCIDGTVGMWGGIKSMFAEFENFSLQMESDLVAADWVKNEILI